MINESTIRAAFAVLSAAGHKPPAAFQRDDGLEQAVLVYTAALRQLTPAELEQAVEVWVGSTNPWWPTSGQLLDLVGPRRVVYPLLEDKQQPLWFVKADGDGDWNSDWATDGAWYMAASALEAIAMFLELCEVWGDERPTSVLVTPEGGLEARVELGGAG